MTPTKNEPTVSLADSTAETATAASLALEEVGLDLTPAERLRALVDVNLDGRLDPRKLPSVRMPTAGATRWTVPSLQGAPDEPAELVGVVIGSMKSRAYWPDAVGEGDVFPACSSGDALTGVGDPGGHCPSCPHAAWGSGRRSEKDTSRRQACREFRVLFLATEERALPLVVRLGPASIRPWERYQGLLAGYGVLVHEVVTNLGLEKVSRAGLEFAVVHPAVRRRLDMYTSRQAGEVAAVVRELLDMTRLMAEAERPVAVHLVSSGPAGTAATVHEQPDEEGF